MWRTQPRSWRKWWQVLAELKQREVLEKHRATLEYVAEALVAIAGIPQMAEHMLRRIAPRDQAELEAVSMLYQRIKGHSIDELKEPENFCKIFLKFKPTSYQLKLIADQSKRIAVRGARQSGKSYALAVKTILFCITHPSSKALYAAPSFRQSKTSFRKVKEHLATLDPVVRRAWVLEELKTKVRFTNGSEAEAFPYALERLRGETCDYILVDEAAFIPDDEELFEGVLKPMLATRWERGAQLIACSTPWGTNNYFYRIFKDPRVAPEWSHQVWTWREAVAESVIPMSFIESEMQTKDMNFFKREYEVEFVSDEGSWLTQDLINCCLDADEQFWDFEEYHTGEFYMGLDLGKKVDYSVLTVVEKVGDELYVRHVKIWPLETPYSAVIGYVKVLSERLHSPYKILVDQSGVGEYVVEDMLGSGISNLEGVVLTGPKKVEIAGYLKQKMQENCEQDSKGKWTGTSSFHIPYPEDSELVRRIIAELNVEKYALTKEGSIKFYHQEGTHDDVFWSMALAVYASKGGAGITISPL
ncbi:MAG: terminase family protein [Nitrososphaerota archaeon]